MLQILALGQLQVFLDQILLTGFISQKARALLVYLALESKSPISREKLMGIFWPELTEDRARHNLRQALSNIRKLIGDNNREEPFLNVNRQDIQFVSKENVSLDVENFKAIISTTHSHSHRRVEACTACIKNLEEAKALYQGDFLEGFFIDGCEAFNDWRGHQQVEIQRIAEETLSILLSVYMAKGKFVLAESILTPLIRMSPWNENFHRAMMRLSVFSDNKSAGLAYYSSFAEKLNKEIGVAPEMETQALYEQISRGEPISSPVPAHNLREFTTDFVGREREIALIDTSLRDVSPRLVSLIGLGGVGKTTLAMQAAQNSKFGFKDGAYFFSVETATNELEAIYMMADVLGLNLHGDGGIVAQMVEFLAPKEMLLILDNYETLLPELSLITSILENAPDVKMLVTSRQLLKLKAEKVIEIKGLTYPETLEEGLAGYSAIEFFRYRIEQMGKIVETDENRHVLQICQILEGHPLGIELTTAWIWDYSIEQITNEIQADLEFVKANMADIPERQRSLWTVLEHTWRLLTEEEQQVFCDLSVFVGGFGLEAILSVIETKPEIIKKLQERSLIREIAPKIYQFHNLVHQFAREKAAEDTQRKEAAFIRYYQYYLNYLADTKDKIKTEKQPEALQDMQGNLENVLAAWDHAVITNDFPSIHIMIEPLYLYYDIRGQVLLGAEQLERVVNLIAEEPEEAPTNLLIRVYPRYARFAFRIGKQEEARDLIMQAKGLAQLDRETLDYGYLITRLAAFEYEAGRMEEAIKISQEGVAVYEKINAPWDEALFFGNLGAMYNQANDSEKALEILLRALALSKEVGDHWNIASVLNNLGVLSHLTKNFEDAVKYYEESIYSHAVIKDVRGKAIALNNLGESLVELEKYEDARKKYYEAITLFNESGNRWGVPYCLVGLGGIELVLEGKEAAKKSYTESFTLAMEYQILPIALISLVGLCKTLSMKEDYALIYQVLSFVTGHESAIRETQDNSAEMLSEAENLVSPKEKTAASEGAKGLTLETVLILFTD